MKKALIFFSGMTLAQFPKVDLLMFVGFCSKMTLKDRPCTTPYVSYIYVTFGFKLKSCFQYVDSVSNLILMFPISVVWLQYTFLCFQTQMMFCKLALWAPWPKYFNQMVIVDMVDPAHVSCDHMSHLLMLIHHFFSRKTIKLPIK